MKVQLATLVLAEQGYMQFKLHLHDDLRQRLQDLGRGSLRDELRNSLSRHLKRRFDEEPWFLFVMEEHTKTGTLTRPHAHGSVAIRPAKLFEKGEHRRRLRKLAATDGLAVAELEAGRLLTRQALAAAGGALSHSSVSVTTGVDQSRNLWTRRPYHPFFNDQWVDYAFKNARAFSPSLGDQRLALPYGLRAEARRLWALITIGEEAIDQWD